MAVGVAEEVRSEAEEVHPEAQALPEVEEEVEALVEAPLAGKRSPFPASSVAY